MGKTERPKVSISNNFRSLPLETKRLLILGLTLALVVALPLFIWAVKNNNFNPFKRAASGEPAPSTIPTSIPPSPPPPPPPSACVPNSQRIINLTPPGSAGTCHDLQTAINSVTYGQITIRVARGTYDIPETKDTFSIRILNKNDLKITGFPQTDPHATVIRFNGNRGGISVQGSSGSIENISVVGKTSNGLIRIERSPNYDLKNSIFNDQGANTISINSSSDNEISESEISGSSVGLYPSNSGQVSVFKTKFHDNNIAIANSNTPLAIRYSLFERNSEQDLHWTGSGFVELYSNTLIRTSNNTRSSVLIDYSTAESRFIAGRNIIVSSGGAIQNTSSNLRNYEFEYNDFFGSQTNYIGLPDQTGTNGNISADPLFGTGYCLKNGSPAIFGSGADYMGHKGPCNAIPPSPAPTPTPTSTPTLTPTPTPTPTPPTTVWYQNLKFKVALTGVEGASAEGAKVKIRFEKQGTGYDYETPPVSLTYSGNNLYEVTLSLVNQTNPVIPVGDGYVIRIKGEKHLARRFCQQTGQVARCTGPGLIYIGATNAPYTQVFDFSGLPLEPGDLYIQDGVADSNDFAKIKNLLGKACSDLTDIDKLTADLDYNGCINTRDAFLMRETLENRYDE